MIFHNVFANSIWGKRYIKTGSVKKPEYVSKAKSRRDVKRMNQVKDQAKSQDQHQPAEDSGQDYSEDTIPFSKELVEAGGGHDDDDNELPGTAVMTVPDDISELVVENSVDIVFAEIGVSNDVFTKNDPLLIENEQQEERLKSLYWLDIVEMLLLMGAFPLYLLWGNETLPFGLMFPVHCMVLIGVFFTYFFVGRTIDFDAVTTYKKPS